MRIRPERQKDPVPCQMSTLSRTSGLVRCQQSAEPRDPSSIPVRGGLSQEAMGAQGPRPECGSAETCCLAFVKSFPHVRTGSWVTLSGGVSFWHSQSLRAHLVPFDLASIVQERVKQGQPPLSGGSPSPSLDRKVRGEANIRGGLCRWK